MSVTDIVKEVFMVRRSDLGPGTVIMDMPEWDSLTHMLFITRLEGDLQVTFTGDEIAQMRTIGDVEAALAARKVTAG